VPAAAAWLWVGLVVASFVARALCDMVRSGAGAAPLGVDAARAAELRRTRAAVLGMAVALGSASVLVFPVGQFQSQIFLAFMAAGLAAGALTLTSFDLRVAMGYAVIVLAPLILRLVATGEPTATATGIASGLFVLFLALNGQRAQRNMQLMVAVREAGAQRTESLLESQGRLEQATAELRRASEELRLTFEHTDQGIFCIGADGRTSFYNRRMCELTGLPESLEGIPAPVPPQYFRRTHLGTVLDVKTAPLPGGGFVRTFADVTALVAANERLQASEVQSRKLALVASNTDDAVIITDAERRIEWVNDAFTRLTGYALAEVMGRRTAEFMRGPQTDPEAVARIDEALLRDKKGTGEVLHCRKDGTAYWFALETRVILDEGGTVCHHIGIGRDVTARRQAEQALRAARDEAERASRAKSDFLSAYPSRPGHRHQRQRDARRCRARPRGGLRRLPDQAAGRDGAARRGAAAAGGGPRRAASSLSRGRRSTSASSPSAGG
jgi:PAS domain S-box-containing protein